MRGIYANNPHHVGIASMCIDDGPSTKSLFQLLCRIEQRSQGGKSFRVSDSNPGILCERQVCQSPTSYRGDSILLINNSISIQILQLRTETKMLLNIPALVRIL